MKNKKGFTLVELLAVIVVLAIILVIAVPRILETIKQSKVGAIQSSTKLIAKSAEQKQLENESIGNTNTISCTGVAEYNTEDYGSCNITFNNNIATVKLKGKKGGRFEGITCTGTKDNVTCSESESEVPVNECTFEGELVQGAEYTNGQYTYKYKQELVGNSWSNILEDGWGVVLSDKESTSPVTTRLCTSINNKPIVSMYAMFQGSKTSSIDLSSFDTSKVKYASGMFSMITLNELDISNLDMSNITTANGMFSGSSINSELDFSDKDISKMSSNSGMFSGANVKSINLSGANLSSLTSTSGMFSGANIDNINLNNTNLSSVTSFGGMFGGTYGSIDMSNTNLSGMTSTTGMFGNITINTLDLSKLDFSNVTDVSGTFYDAHITTCLTKTQADADKLNASSNKPDTFTCVVKS